MILILFVVIKFVDSNIFLNFFDFFVFFFVDIIILGFVVIINFGFFCCLYN